MVKILVVLADLGLVRMRGRRLRRPTPEQLDEFSAPIGDIMARRVDVAKYGPDVYALTMAGGAFSDWLGDGALTKPVQTVEQVGMETVPVPFTVQPEASPFPPIITNETTETSIPIDLTGPVKFLE